jgi:hypothetical protein
VNGNYELKELLPGIYAVNARLPGFSRNSINDIQLKSGAPFEWNPRLSVAAVNPVSVEEYVTMLVGFSPRQCGQLNGRDDQATQEAMNLALKCGTTAAAARSPFWLVRRSTGADTELASGLLGTATGVIYRFSYDKTPCGGVGCDSQFSISRCDEPFVGKLMGFVGQLMFLCRQK